MANELFLVKIPQGDNPASTFEQLLTNLHEVMADHAVGFELVSKDQHIYFYCRVPSEYFTVMEGQIYAKYPQAEIEHKAAEYTTALLKSNIGFAGAELYLIRNEIYPIKTYKEFSGDSLAGIFSILSKATENEQIWIQVVAQPLMDDWKLHFRRSWKLKFASMRNIFRLKDYFNVKGRKQLRSDEQEAFKHKAAEHTYQVNIRMAYSAPSQQVAAVKLKALDHAFTQFNTINLNGFHGVRSARKESFIEKYRNLIFESPYFLSVHELASVYHLPNPDEVPHIVHVVSRKSEPPEDLPKLGATKESDMSVFGITNYHNQGITFGIKRADRRRHLYAVGKSGTGKSKMMELLINADIQAGKGVGVLDPHGDLVDAVLKYVPEHRMKDVILFDPSDLEYPIAFNPLEGVEPEFRLRVTIGFIEIFKKLFGTENWTPRLEHVLRYTTLALLDSPKTTVLSIVKMLSDKNYRQKIVSQISDSVVKNFWVNEFAAWSEKFDNEAIMPLLNKVGQFVATSLIRNIVGQPENKINIREIMDKEKILLMKISKGKLGEENCGLIGAMMVTKIQQAAMGRADTLEEDRKDFYLYCDEFQYFATDTFAEILSEARKYRLNITMAHQYMGQLSSIIKTTVFGNVGSIINFRVGAEDAVILEKEYTPKFNVRDIINLGVREFYIKMSVDGQVRDAFSAKTINVPKYNYDYSKTIIDNSRRQYCRPRTEVEQILAKWEEGAKEVDANASLKAGEEDFAAPLV